MNKIVSNLRNVLFALMSILMLTACSKDSTKKTPEQLFKEYSSGVVLIYSEYYYSITLPNGQTLYTQGLSDNGDVEYVTTDEELIKQNCSRKFGTGFFIDSKGDIMTNRHVVDVSIDEVEVQERIAASLRAERQTYADSMNMAMQVMDDLKEKREKCYYLDYWGNICTNQEKLYEINNTIAYVAEKYEEWNYLYKYFSANSNPRDIKIDVYQKLGIAYNDTYVDDYDDFLGSNACVVRKVSKKKNADLAIIRLKSRQTPDSVYVFDVSGMVMKEKKSKSFGDYFNQIVLGKTPMEKVKVDELKMNQKLHMIGYNHGIILAQTREGIQAQFTHGEVIQQPDGETLRHDVSSMQGSSGSPIIDDDGNLRGVNFGKISLQDNFNFAVPMNLVKNFLKE